MSFILFLNFINKILKLDLIYSKICKLYQHSLGCQRTKSSIFHTLFPLYLDLIHNILRIINIPLLPYIDFLNLLVQLHMTSFKFLRFFVLQLNFFDTIFKLQYGQIEVDNMLPYRKMYLHILYFKFLLFFLKFYNFSNTK